MTEKEFKKYEGKTTFGFAGRVNIDGCIVIGYNSTKNGDLIVGCYDSRGWICLLTTDVVDENLKRQFESFLYVNVENVKIEKDLDLTSILRGCEGVELWSDICGKCVFIKINDEDEEKHPICVGATEDDGMIVHECFSNNGRYNSYYPDGNCLLWPSETNRDWSTFKKPTNIKEGDWVVCGWSVRDVIIRRYFKDNKCFNAESSTTLEWAFIAPFEKYNPNLTEEELKKLSIV